MENSVVTKEMLDDLGSRFIINLPESERKDLIRVCFQMELAHWYYIDFYCKTPGSKKCGIKEFFYSMFNHIPFLRRHVSKLDEVLDNWREYKQSVPTHGAIILDEDMSHVLLVQGYYAKSSWGFPKGKVNEEEEPMRCAIREVLEETGLDISNMVDENEFVETYINDQCVRLYLVAGVPHNTKFSPHTRCEIRAVEWFLVSDLPVSRKDTSTKLKNGLGPNNFFMVIPFVKRIRNWIAERQQKSLMQSQLSTQSPQMFQMPRRQRMKSQGEMDNGKGKKQQQQFPQTVKVDVFENQQFKQNRAQNTPNNQPRNRNNNGRGKATPGTGSKRQLFSNENGGQAGASALPQNDKSIKVQYAADGAVIFTAPSWINFQFNKERLMREIMG